jgi:two-component system, chemotaxis family, sensor kinase CheA
MSDRRGFSIRYKLALLAGVPVIGALLLSGIIVRDARRQVESAAALGSVEDLALLAGHISTSVHQLQNERALISRGFGEAPGPQLKAAEAETDKALNELNQFLSHRDMNKLPKRLARDLSSARSQLTTLPARREAAADPSSDFVQLLNFYASANGSLISAITALMQLSDEGELLRAISSLVSVLQFKESASQEHSILANVFQHNEFPPGGYKVLVTMVTEQALNERGFRQNAGDEAQALFDHVLKGEFMTKTAQMRQRALDTMYDAFNVSADEWMSLQGKKVDALRGLENTLSERMRTVALKKIEATRSNLTTSLTLAGGVLVISILLAALIARGVTRSVSSLSEAARRVREDKDFSVRATKISSDELGVLTEAFNEMLGGIQARDTELEEHRHNLEALVAARTAELSARNEAMRIVLDNVEEGLATINLDGSLARETSASFARWFGAPVDGATLGQHMARVNEDAGLTFRLGWDSIIEDVLPWELSLEQMPRKLRTNGRHYELTYRPIMQDSKLNAALMVVADVTELLERERRAAEQQEALKVFEHIMQDRHGFNEFMLEAGRLVDLTRKPEACTVQELMRAVHTVKGNCAIFGVQSIASIAHDLESFIVEQQAVPEPAALAALHEAWEKFSKRIQELHGDDEDVLELHQSELARVIENIERRAPHEQLAAQVRELTFEPVQRRFMRLADRAKALAARLGKDDLVIEQDGGNVRLPVEPWAEFWGAFVHVVRNAVDHGLESSRERKEAGKQGPAKLRFVCRVQDSECQIELSDNGHGVAWERIREKAQGLGLPHATREQLVAAMFTDGLSTREQASDTSGRGVGMSAVREACSTLGGRIEVISEPGQGTTFRFCMPYQSGARGARKVA